MGSVWDFRSGLDAAVTAHATGSRASPPGHIDSRAMTEAVADSDSFVSPDRPLCWKHGGAKEQIRQE